MIFFLWWVRGIYVVKYKYSALLGFNSLKQQWRESWTRQSNLIIHVLTTSCQYFNLKGDTWWFLASVNNQTQWTMHKLFLWQVRKEGWTLEKGLRLSYWIPVHNIVFRSVNTFKHQISKQASMKDWKLQCLCRQSSPEA